MDSQTAKKDIDVNILQNQDDNLSNVTEEGVDVAATELVNEELHPLQIGNIVETILSFLNVESIKSARQVNKLWKNEGAKLLISKCFVNIPSILQAQDFPLRRIVMDEFKSFLSCNLREISIIPNITIGAAGDLELWKSLDVLGPEVKSVQLKFYDKEAELLRNLFGLLPNLNHLSFNDNQLQKYRSSIIKVLTTVMSGKEKDGKTLLISRMTLKPYDLMELEIMEKFADLKNIRFTDLNFNAFDRLLLRVPNFKARIANMLGKLLHTSRNTIKCLILDGCEFFLPLLEFPCMTELTDMTLVFIPLTTGQLSQCKFAPSFRFSEKVPNLQFLFIDHSQNPKLPFKADFLKNLFKSTKTASSVKRLYCHSDDVAIDSVLKTFPNIEDLQMRVSSRPGIFHSIWTLGINLRRLHLRIELDRFVNDLDSFFTGFTSEAVEKIKKEPNLGSYTLNELEKLRVHPSILNLKELEHLTISFVGGQRQLPERMLLVSGKYAFKMLPKDPKILVRAGSFSHNRGMIALQEVAKLPNVTVQQF